MESDEIVTRVMRIAEFPTRDTPLWTRAGDPWSFLAFALEYGRYLDETGYSRARREAANLSFETGLPISMDASTSGYQHMALALRDRHDAAATNLLPGPRRDLYAGGRSPARRARGAA